MAPLFKRDKGVCAHCGLDCSQFEDASWKLRHLLRVPHPFRNYPVNLLELLGWDTAKTFWEADHVLERHDGGPHTLENLQTLCQRCHKVKTRAFASRRARRRKLALQPELSGLELSFVGVNSPTRS
jgi:5-methylcytosine-specific restriction endonuclease McrA